MKKIAILLLLLCCTQYIAAQKMTDDQVIEYVMSAQEKGLSQQQIAKDLLRRGVSMDQVNRIKRKMESQEKNGMGSTLTEKMRTRTAPKKNGAIELQSDKDAVKNMKVSERETMMGEEIGFLFHVSHLIFRIRKIFLCLRKLGFKPGVFFIGFFQFLPSQQVGIGSQLLYFIFQSGYGILCLPQFICQTDTFILCGLQTGNFRG